nr:hypothetical protein [Verrucomicrobiales bacterium]
MIQKFLGTYLGPIIAAEKLLRRRKLVASVLFLAAISFAALAALSYIQEWWSWRAVFVVLALLLVGTLIGLARIRRSTPDLRELAKRIEERYPELRAALLAVMDQNPGPDGELGFLQKRLLGEVSDHAVTHQWVKKVSQRRLAAAAWGQFAAILAFGVGLWFLLGQAPMLGSRPHLATKGTKGDAPVSTEVTIQVTPGDVELEKGSRLVVEANFKGRAPSAALLVIQNAGGEFRLPMNVGLDDSVFSTVIPKVDEDSVYHVSYETAKSDEFSITTFDLPALLQANATITPPDYIGGEKTEITDTRKITVMEGSQVTWGLRINKAVAAGELFSESGEIIPLAPDPSDPTLLLVSHTPAETGRYRVHLVDEKDRGNAHPPWLTVNVTKNLPPKLKLTFPGRDFEVSALQELPLEAEVWDDVEVIKTGMTYLFKGKETTLTLSESALAGGKTHALSTLIDVESLDAKERDLITYYFWAEDRDREGQIRRTSSDMFFAEVRLFEEIVREGQPQSGKGSPPSGGDADGLIKLQQDIVNAAWKIVRDHQAKRPFSEIAENLSVVQESQGVAISQLDEVLEKVKDPELLQIFAEAKTIMETALIEFADAGTKEDGNLVSIGHASSLKAYAKLIEARAREMEISKSKSQTPGEPKERQQRNMNLELEQKELKYEENSEAQDPAKSAEQKENLAVLNRLKDLARRQEAIAEKIKELENQLQKASGEKKAEIERQLKRLQEEQQELIRDLDDLAERMNSEENRANMAEEKEELNETRENVQKTAEELESGDLATASNAATRAKEQLEKMQEEFREKTSRQFASEMKTLRDASRELAEKQKSIGEKIEGMAREPQGNETDPDGQKARGELAQAIQEQSEKVSEIVEQMRTLSEASEVSEPLLSDALYETVRNTTMNGIEDSLEEVRNLTYFNRGPQAATAEKVAARGIEELKESIEKAAEKVLGNEADALRLARSELDRLIEESKSETERLSGTEGEKPSTKEGQSADQTGSRPGREPGEKGEKGEPSATPGTGTEKGKGEIAGKGDTPGKGEGKEKGQGESPESLAGGGHDGEPGGTPKRTPKGSPKGSSPAGGNQRGG